MHTTDIGRAFFHVIRIRPKTPPFHLADTVEIEPPYRRSRSLVTRVSWRRALVLGWWRDTSWDEEEALMRAVEGWGLDPYDDSLEDPQVKKFIRQNVALQTDDPDEEWEIIDMLGAS